ncbi:hypothetical protein AXG93_4888s1050 [Marchantia polymorpha subsp. ruderalis]|uniref:Uncharacterized protein n=1 Tax=Marchantia polymorpha subsp. ruderalis TaxID=1480154 RepID=A0A176VIA1_MARPO|nr:hypothetical protein AXG93_4888s1050 [Marchantia polymorpha subsp. ruderalis]
MAAYDPYKVPELDGKEYPSSLRGMKSLGKKHQGYHNLRHADGNSSAKDDTWTARVGAGIPVTRHGRNSEATLRSAESRQAGAIPRRQAGSPTEWHVAFVRSDDRSDMKLWPSRKKCNELSQEQRSLEE